MKFPCPQCQQRLSAEESMAGQSLECPRCGHWLIVPAIEAPTPPAGESWVNPLKSADAEPLQPSPKAQHATRPKRVKQAPIRVVTKSGGPWKPLLLLVVIVAAGVAYWKHVVGSRDQAMTVPVAVEVPAPPTPAPLPVEESPPSQSSELSPPDSPQPAPPAIQPKPEGDLGTSAFGTTTGQTEEPEVARPAADPADTPTSTTSSASTEIESISMDGGAMAAPTGNKTKLPFPTTNLLAVTLSHPQQSAKLASRKITLSGKAQLSLSDESDPLPGSVVNFTSPDAWLILESMPPSRVISDLLPRMWVKGEPAELDQNIRVVRYENGTVVIPHAPDYPAMTVYNSKGMNGASMPLTCFTPYNEERLGTMKGAISSFRLKRGYMATLAQNENGTGISQNYVAQDKDIEVSSLPAGLDQNVRFIRIFPWRWTHKKGVAGGIWQKLNVSWFYDWNIGANSSPDIEYVAIKQKRYWPGLNQDWKRKGTVHLLGYNEPDRPDQAKMTPDEAIAGWPELLGTGLRLGSPAVSDGGLGWLYQFMEKADAAKLRVDFIAVHYYRATPGNNPKAAADQMYGFLKDIHDRTKRPIWITEWNNGANWTGGDDPSVSEQKECIEEMIKMLDKADFVERYAIYNWVEECRNVIGKNGEPTPAGVVYRDKRSPMAYEQPKR